MAEELLGESAVSNKEKEDIEGTSGIQTIVDEWIREEEGLDSEASTGLLPDEEIILPKSYWTRQA